MARLKAPLHTDITCCACSLSRLIQATVGLSFAASKPPPGITIRSAWGASANVYFGVSFTASPALVVTESFFGATVNTSKPASNKTSSGPE